MTAPAAARTSVADAQLDAVVLVELAASDGGVRGNAGVFAVVVGAEESAPYWRCVATWLAVWLAGALGGPGVEAFAAPRREEAIRRLLAGGGPSGGEA
jgi:hypothetical protein